MTFLLRVKSHLINAHIHIEDKLFPTKKKIIKIKVLKIYYSAKTFHAQIIIIIDCSPLNLSDIATQRVY